MTMPRALFTLLAASMLLILGGCSHANNEPAPTETQHYEPTWESIHQHEAPEWFHDAKFGIFIHWGLYSVPAWATPSGKLYEVDWDAWFKNNAYAEWYLNTLRIDGSPTQQHHYKTYGKDFDYFDFIPAFEKEVQEWDPNQMAGVFKDIGAQYVVLTSRHCESYALWPTKVVNPHLGPNQQHCPRDLVGELTNAVRAQGMRMGLYYCGGMDWTFSTKPITTIVDCFTTIPNTEEYARYADAHWRELIDCYEPSILWNDIAYPRPGKLKEILSEYYNRVPDGVINNRWGNGLPNPPGKEGSAPPKKEGSHYDFLTPEYQQMEEITQYKWETCRGLGYSFGYNQLEGPEHTLTEAELIHLLIDIVSKNGNLLLNVGPRADGSIPEIQMSRLRALGDWLRVNGEAIYGTRPWERAEGRTSDGIDVRFTRKGDTTYVFLLGEPKGGEVTIESLSIPVGATVRLLGSTGELTYKTGDNKSTVTLPETVPESHACVLSVSV